VLLLTFVIFHKIDNSEPPKVKFAGRRAPFPDDPVERLVGGGDVSFLIWLIMVMPNKAR
jgi:hypothetical protein